MMPLEPMGERAATFLTDDVDMLVGHFAKKRNVVDGQGETASGGACTWGAWPYGGWGCAWLR